MGKIKILPDNVINKIAAGEVIERPASVVKELIENSLDAHANSIVVTVKHGGKELIRVTDDGEGMGPEDAENSLKRHATSKIEALEDIFRIRSFGFRGEALPSIATISRLVLLTRPPESAHGTEIKAPGGVIESVREAGVALGTTLEVMDLFFNTPARKKFLRSERAELLAIVDTLTNFALGNPTVAFKLLKDNKPLGEFPACVSLRERIAQTHDPEVVEALIPINVSTDEIKIAGFMTSPEVNRINRTGQYFYINNRPIKNVALSFALQRGYDTMLPQNRFPLAFLFLDIELSKVDVNVHPHKKEVRVANERDVQKLLIDTVQQTLHAKNKFPKLTVIATQKTREEETYLLENHHPQTAYTTPEKFSGFSVVKEPSLAFSSSPGKKEEEIFFSAENEKSIEQKKPFESRGIKILGHFQATYIIAESEGHLFIIDQHAAHERIVYEKILATLINCHAPSQLHLIPVTFSLDYREQEVLEEYLPLLEKVGFGINNLGRNTFSLDATPSFLDSVDPKQLLLDFIHDTMERQFSGKAFDDKMKTLAAGIACKSKSVKASSHLISEKMEHLVKSLFQTQQPFTCPHGRPTCITLALQDLEKQFGRK